MHKTAYIFPVAIAGVLVLLFHNYDLWWMYLIMIAVCELILALIIHRASRTAEYLSGFALNVQHHEPWTERVKRTEYYTDSQGNSRSRTVVEYVHHPDAWFMPLNTGMCIPITRGVYDYYRTIWQTPEEWINPYHPNCVSGGGGQLHMWNGEYENAATHTYKGLYINYVANSNSIFRKERITKSDIEKYGLIDYPKFERRQLEIDAVLRSPKLPAWARASQKSQQAFQLLNAFAGARHQIHVFVLLFDYSQGITTALKQQAYWKGGNKNEFVVCLGVDVSHIEPEKIKNKVPPIAVKWCKAFSWCDMPRLESATESYFIENNELHLNNFAEWLRGHMGLWKRKEFKDFKYLGVQLSPKRKRMVAITTALFCIIMVVITCIVAVRARRNDYANQDKYSGIGYELLDRYIL